MIEYHIIWGCR